MRALVAIALTLLALLPAMTYATQQNLIDRFGEQEIVQLTDRDGTGVIDAAVVTKALEDADGEINARIALKYTVPLTPVPTIVVRLAADIARYFLYEDRVTEAVKARYDAVIRLLEQVGAGRASLGPDAVGAEPSVAGGPEAEAPERIFTHDSLADFG